jgi:hypothetical protein
MFDFRAALVNAGARDLDFNGLLELLQRIRQEHLADISPEIGVRELMQIAQEQNLIQEDDAGKFHIEKAA